VSNLFLEFIFAFLGTFGFTIIFNVPLRHMAVASFVGGLGSITYHIAMDFGTTITIGCFLGACMVGLASDAASRICKEAATIFVIPGVLPLVPGAGTYYTMLAIVEGDLNNAAAQGIQTLAMAGSIALGLLVVGTMVQIILSTAASLRKDEIQTK